jgi:hypothetical protein
MLNAATRCEARAWWWLHWPQLLCTFSDLLQARVSKFCLSSPTQATSTAFNISSHASRNASRSLRQACGGTQTMRMNICEAAIPAPPGEGGRAIESGQATKQADSWRQPCPSTRCDCWTPAVDATWKLNGCFAKQSGLFPPHGEYGASSLAWPRLHLEI